MGFRARLRKRNAVFGTGARRDPRLHRDRRHAQDDLAILIIKNRGVNRCRTLNHSNSRQPVAISSGGEGRLLTRIDSRSGKKKEEGKLRETVVVTL